jgi:predicted metal-dependent phosphoesterase TrpH
MEKKGNKNFKSVANFHIHTTHSDGALTTVFDMVLDLRDAGVKYFSITDHDTTDGNDESSYLAETYGIRFSKREYNT